MGLVADRPQLHLRPRANLLSGQRAASHLAQRPSISGGVPRAVADEPVPRVANLAGVDFSVSRSPIFSLVPALKTGR